MYNSHEIHFVKDDTIKAKWFGIDEFAVRLKLIRNRKAEKSYKGEVKRYIEDLNRATGGDVEIDKLVDNECRVTYLRGIAGVGKSVLAKQIIFGWATGKMYTEFKLCLYFECRDLNDYFIANVKGNLDKRRMLENFIAGKLFGHDAEDGQRMLIVIDGLDELFDIQQKESIIFLLLDKRKSYRKAQIIITGRPHVESMLDRPRLDMGGYKVVEIMGLADKEIQEYIKKFCKCSGEEYLDENAKFINSTRESSEGVHCIMSIPQFLNTLCCVAVLTKGKKIRNVTELYCWTLFLLLKQHIAEKESDDQQFISTVFDKYEQWLLLLGEISYELLRKNEIVFRKEKFKRLFDQIERIESQAQRNFLESLFVDVSDNFFKKFQFKHLSIMEFLAAIYCFSLGDVFQIVTELLQQNLFEVVSYLCGFYGSVCEMDDGIVRELVACISNERQYNRKLLIIALDQLFQSQLRADEKLSHGLQFLAEYLPPFCKNKEIVNDIMAKIRSIGDTRFEPTTVDQLNLLQLFKVMKECDMEDDDIRSTFAGIKIEDCYFKTLDFIELWRYLGQVEQVNLNNKTVNCRELGVIASSLDYCEFLVIVGCRFNGDGYSSEHINKVTGIRIENSRTEELILKDCQLAERSFYVFNDLLKLSKRVKLINVDIFHGSNNNLIEESQIIEEHDLKLERLYIERTSFNDQTFKSASNNFVMVKIVELEKIQIGGSWWEDLVKEIENAKNRGSLKLEVLWVRHCTYIEEHMKKRVR